MYSFTATIFKKLTIFSFCLNLMAGGHCHEGQKEAMCWLPQKINEINAYLEGEKQLIEMIEKEIKSKEAVLKQNLNQFNYYRQIGYIHEYNFGVDDYNHLLNAYKQDINAYHNKIVAYNVKVNEVNVLIKKSGSRVYLIPIPTPGYGSKVKSTNNLKVE